MSKIAEWIEEALNGEDIEAVVIGRHDRDRWGAVGTSAFNGATINKVVSWDEAKPFLSYEFDSGYGSAGCHPVYVWTPTRIFFVGEYDGSTSLSWVPRHPIPCEPQFSGG